VAKCQLTVVLDDQGRPCIGGEKVRGTVVVRADQSVTCRGLEVTSRWATHGAGNIDRGEIDHATLFQGAWDEGQAYRYPFELDTAAWPPSYYGRLLNVSQFVEAHAKLSWATDPRATVEIPVVVTAAPESLTPVTKARPASLVGWMVGLVVGLLLLVPLLLLLGMAILFILPLLAIGGAVTWFVWSYLPSRLTGRVECEVSPVRVAAGDTIKCSLKFTPKRSLTINGITWKVTATEQCKAGSGSNRKTHTHVAFQELRWLAETGQLEAGSPQAYAFEFPVPATAPPSLKFNDNELRWEAEVRIDIPGWPDWVKTFKLVVTPAVNPVDRGSTESESPPPSTKGDLTFDEVAKLITALIGDPDRRRLVVEKITGQSFDVTLDLDSPEEDDGRIGRWLDGWHRPTDLDVEVRWPEGTDLPITPVSGWKGTATFVGFDEARNCVLMHAVARPT
jgi:hypothetical protein